MITIIWLVSGSIIISSTFLLCYNSTGDYWFAGEIASITAAGLLFTFLIYISRPPVPKKTRKVLISSFIILSVLTTICWLHEKRESSWQKETLVEIRKSIDNEAFKVAIYDILLTTMYVYYQQSGNSLSLKEAFEDEKTKSRLVEWQEYVEWDSLAIYVADANADSIVLIWQDNFFEGKNSSYSNFNGKVGKRQKKAILTENGIICKKEN